MPRRQRLDAELVRRGLARSRQQAAEMVTAGKVTVGGRLPAKPATQVDLGAAIVVAAAPEQAWVSRGAHKLLGALDATGVDPAGRRCLDAGASTGGFTQVLLARGAAHVVAVDVGYGQLAWPLRQDERVTVLERTNVRDLRPDQVAPAPTPAPTLAVADLSFISLRLVLPALARCVAAAADLLVMVKPQFEVGREAIGAGGVVRDPQRRTQAVLDVATAARRCELAVRAAVASPLPGPSGNVEYFLYLRRGELGPTAGPDEPDLAAMVRAAVAAGPGGGAGEPGDDAGSGVDAVPVAASPPGGAVVR